MPEDFNIVSELDDSGSKATLSEEGFDKNDSHEIEIFADLKYVGQTWTLGVKFPAFPADDTTCYELAASLYSVRTELRYTFRQREYVRVAVKVIGRGRSETSRMPEHIFRGQEKILASERPAFLAMAWVGVILKSPSH